MKVRHAGTLLAISALGAVFGTIAALYFEQNGLTVLRNIFMLVVIGCCMQFFYVFTRK